MANRTEAINTALDQLINDNPNDIAGATIASADGMLISSRLSTEVNADRVAAIAATMMGVTTRVVNDLKIGKAEETIVRSENGYLLVLPITAQVVLALTLRSQANLGMVRIEAREAGRSITAAMNGS